jgi:hypothetical protein
MAFGVSTNNTAGLRNFAQAEHYFNTTAEIRGTNKLSVGVPLQSNRKDWRHKALVKIDDNTYAARLYETNVVTWHRNGEITIDMSYGSQSTNTFANYFIGKAGHAMWLGTEHRQCGIRATHLSEDIVRRMREEGNETSGTDWCEFLIHGKEVSVWFDSQGKTYITPLADAYKKYVDKSKAHDVRKKFNGLFDYLKIFTAFPLEQFDFMLGDYARENHINGRAKTKVDILAKVIANPDDESVWPYFAALYHDNRWAYNSSGGGYRIDFAKLKDIKAELFPRAYTAAGIYSYERLPLGILKAGWTRYHD